MISTIDQEFCNSITDNRGGNVYGVPLVCRRITTLDFLAPIVAKSWWLGAFARCLLSQKFEQLI